MAAAADRPITPDDPMPAWDRFDPRTVDGRLADGLGAYSALVHDGFEPTTLEREKATGGWLRTTQPEGLPLSELHELYVDGSRGAEMRLTKQTAGRTTRRGKKGIIDSSHGHGADGSAPDGGDYDNTGEGYSD